jgi:hypothetical protein
LDSFNEFLTAGENCLTTVFLIDGIPDLLRVWVGLFDSAVF